MRETQTTRVVIIISAILTIILGIIFLMNPFSAGEMTSILLGVFMLVDGVMCIAHYFMIKGHETGRNGTLVVGVLMVLIGIFSFLDPSAMLDVIAFVVSIFMLLIGIMSIDYSFQMRKANLGGVWVLNLILGIIILIGAICMVINPFDAIETTFLFVGVLLLMDGIFEIITAISGGKM